MTVAQRIAEDEKKIKYDHMKLIMMRKIKLGGGRRQSHGTAQRVLIGEADGMVSLHRWKNRDVFSGSRLLR